VESLCKPGEPECGAEPTNAIAGRAVARCGTRGADCRRQRLGNRGRARAGLVAVAVKITQLPASQAWMTGASSRRPGALGSVPPASRR